MNLDLAKVLGEIERGAEQGLQAQQAEFEQMQHEMGNKQVIVGHIEKQEEPEIEEVTPGTHAKQEKAMEPTQAKKAAEQDDTTTTEEDNPMGVPRKYKIQSVTALKKALTEAKLREQQ